MISKYSRTNFYKNETINDNLIYDLVNNYWDLLEIKRPLQFTNITRDYIQRPDLLAYSIYGDVNYWWILCKFNEIYDIWNDMEIGDTISIIDKRDLDTWFLKVYSMKKK